MLLWQFPSVGGGRRGTRAPMDLGVRAAYACRIVPGLEWIRVLRAHQDSQKSAHSPVCPRWGEAPAHKLATCCEGRQREFQPLIATNGKGILKSEHQHGSLHVFPLECIKSTNRICHEAVKAQDLTSVRQVHMFDHSCLFAISRNHALFISRFSASPGNEIRQSGHEIRFRSHLNRRDGRSKSIQFTLSD
jgi:hypothetical protein